MVNKIDLAPHVGVDCIQLERDARAARGARETVMAAVRTGRGVDQIVGFLEREGGLAEVESA